MFIFCYCYYCYFYYCQFYSCYFYFYFYARAEGEATITISTRCRCQNWWGWVTKTNISVTLWFCRPPGATKYYLRGGPHREYPLSWAPHGQRGVVQCSRQLAESESTTPSCLAPIPGEV